MKELSANLAVARHIPIVVLARDGVVVSVTEAAGRELGAASSALVGTRWQDLCVDPPAQTEEYLRMCLRATQPIPVAFRRVVEGVTRRVRCDGYTADSSSGPERVIVLAFRRQDEHDKFVLLGQKLEQLNAEILHRRKRELELAEAITRAEEAQHEQRLARAEAERANRAKDDFLAMLGHELRNPLAPILTAVDLLKIRGKGGGSELLVIERQVQHLVRLVDDLLDVSRIATGKIELRRQHVELASVVERALEMVSPLLEKRKHNVVLDVPPRGLVVDGDAPRLSQVVSNLLHNAAKYSPPGTSIWIAAQSSDAAVQLTVRDEGAGIPPEMLPKVFDLFVQAPQPLDRAQGGLGLGLAIVQNLVRLHGGTIEARSEGVGRGAEFTVRLPAVVQAPIEASRDDRAGRRTPAPASLRVLVVDDNPDACDLLSDALAACGQETRVAYDGPHALRVAREFLPEVAVVDIGLPVMDGYELALQLRAQPELVGIRLIAVSGYGQESDLRRSHTAGFEAHLVKPVELAQLQDAILHPVPRGD